MVAIEGQYLSKDEKDPQPLSISNPALESFWWDDETIRIRVLYGGRSSSKSWDAAAVAIVIASNCCLKFLCTRQFQARITDSVYTLLKQTIIRLRLGSIFDIQRNKIICIRTGSEFVFYGLWRNIEEIRGMEGIGILWIEEGHLLTKEQWQILEPTIVRNKDYQIWMIFNPRLLTDFAYKRFVIKPPKNTLVRKINYLENPYLNEQAIEAIEGVKDESEEDYRHFYLGEPRTNDNESIIKLSWLMSAVDAHVKLGITPTGSDRIGFDVADDGADLCATATAKGSLTTAIDKWKGKEDEILMSCTKVHNIAKIINAEIIYDAIGVGSSCGAKFNELGYRNHKKFFAGGAVVSPDSFIDRISRIKNRDFYSNVKAQAWWMVAERLKNTHIAITTGKAFDESDMIFISSECEHLEELIEELSTPRKSFDTAGKVKVESKEDLKKRGIASPNQADAFIMAHLDPKMTKTGSYSF